MKFQGKISFYFDASKKEKANIFLEIFNFFLLAEVKWVLMCSIIYHLVLNILTEKLSLVENKDISIVEEQVIN